MDFVSGGAAHLHKSKRYIDNLAGPTQLYQAEVEMVSDREADRAALTRPRWK